MWIFKNRFFAILSAFLILMAVTTGIVCGQETDDSASDTSSDADDSSADDDSSSSEEAPAEDSSSEESSTEESPVKEVEAPEADFSDDGPAAEYGAIYAGDVDESTIIDYEETNSEETTVGVQDADDVVVSGGPVEYEEVNTEITDIGDGSTTINSGGPVRYEEENTEINDIDNMDYSSEYTSTEITTLENSTQEIDNSYDYTDNSTTTINKTEITDIDIDNSKDTNIAVTDNSVVNNINFVSKESGKTKVIVKEVYEKPPVENVYKTFNIFVDNAEVANNMENAAVDFKVEKTWLIENNLDSSTIILNMHEGDKWIEVPVTVTGEDSQYVYFKAKVSKYSTFAISSKAVTVDKVIKQGNISEEEIDGPTKSVVIKMLEFVIELLEGN